ncbi:MAG: hypothetical protein H8E66_01865 [Planctomycetes bacterium]|nr:hypothetical protein [Planctomycetota bacterium]
MRYRGFIAVLLAAALGVPGLVDGECDFDCYEIDVMGGVQSGQSYCYNFEYTTGRLVWSGVGGGIGGNPTSTTCEDDESQQDVEKYNDCDANCALVQIPQEVTLGGNKVGTIGFGCWYCSG